MDFSTLFTDSLPLTITLGGLAIIFIPWLVLLPRLAVSFLLLSLVTGQTLRLPLPGQGGGLLPSDLAVVVVLLATLVQVSRNYRLAKKARAQTASHKPTVPSQVFPKPAQPKLFAYWLVAPFIIWSLFTLLLHAPALGLSNTALASSYWLRLSANLLLLPALIFLLSRHDLRRFVWRGLRLTVLLLAIIGLAQLVLFPDLSPLVRAGWDPHQSRLVSTWLDPNFFGAFLVILLPLVLIRPSLLPPASISVKRKSTLLKKKNRPLATFFATTHDYAYIIILLVVLALIATQSRSALVAAGLAGLLLSPLIIYLNFERLRSRLITPLSLFGLLITIVATLIIILGPRLSGLITVDPTVQLRLTNLAGGWQIARLNSLFGVGYNAYQFAASGARLVSDYSIHSRAGTDNSLLTLWATTGLFGVVLFLLPWAYFLRLFIIWAITRRSLLALAGLYSITTLFIHSQFINSFLYSHLLITLVIIVALVYHRP